MMTSVRQIRRSLYCYNVRYNLRSFSTVENIFEQMDEITKVIARGVLDLRMESIRQKSLCSDHVAMPGSSQSRRPLPRVALARAITLIESTREDHQIQAGLLLNYLHTMVQRPEYCYEDDFQRGWKRLPPHALDKTRTKETAHHQPSSEVSLPLPQAFRIGFVGPPGAGEDTG
jgi:hypothetical protein